MSKLGRKIFLLAVSAAMVAGCQREDGDNQAAGGNSAAAANVSAGNQVPDTTIGQTLAQSGDHSTLMNAVRTAGLEATLSGSQPYTVFAPTNAAFQKLPGGGADLMSEGARGQLTTLLTYHVVPGVVTADDLNKAIAKGGGKTQLATVGGGTLTVTQSGDGIVISNARGGQARVTQADRLQSNGVVHSIDGVLTPG